MKTVNRTGRTPTGGKVLCLAWIVLLCAGLLLPASRAAARDKTDHVVLTNGDLLTGEIKGLSYGRLSFKTDTMETVSIKWDRVSRITSRYIFQVETVDGVRYLGSLGETPEEGALLVMEEDRSITLPKAQVVEMVQIEGVFWKRFSGSISMGFSYTKGSDVAQFSVNGESTYQTKKNVVQLTVSAILTAQKEAATTQSDDFSLTYMRLLPKKWFLISLGSLQKNDELGIDERILVGGGGGRFIVQTNRVALAALASCVLNREWIIGSGPNDLNAEGLAGLRFSIFIHDTPKTQFSTQVLTFAGLTNAGRVRVDYNLSLRQEIIKDFFLEPSGYVSYDNEPPPGAFGETDYGVVTSLGYSF